MSTATSVASSLPRTSRCGSCRPENVTLTELAPSTTCAAVTMWPLPSDTNPVPVARQGRRALAGRAGLSELTPLGGGHGGAGRDAREGARIPGRPRGSHAGLARTSRAPSTPAAAVKSARPRRRRRAPPDQAGVQQATAVAPAGRRRPGRGRRRLRRGGRSGPPGPGLPSQCVVRVGGEVDMEDQFASPTLHGLRARKRFLKFSRPVGGSPTGAPTLRVLTGARARRRP